MENKLSREDIGVEAGEICNRNGCTGAIEAKEREGSCSCHIHPPCSHCVNDPHFCPKCGWEGIEDQWKPQPADSRAQQFYNHMMDRADEYRQNVERLYKGDEEITEFRCIREGHTHFSMIVRGVYPPSMTKEVLLKEIRGTFGGRFERYGGGRFVYIAYTD